MIKGNLHSIETMGLLDGPGIRTIFFLQGCPIKCKYCHNPDSQCTSIKEEITPQEVLKIAKRYKPYYDRTGGGITFSGGEPLLQGEFLLETIKLLKENNIHVTIDTSGYGDFRYIDDIIKHTDLIMLDLKHYSDEGYKDLVETSIKPFNKFLEKLKNYKGKIWVRHVMVPGYTDDEDSINKLFKKISPLAYSIDRIEILPYHRMGVDKYIDLGREYKLKGVPEMDKKVASDYEKVLNQRLRDYNKNLKNGLVNF